MPTTGNLFCTIWAGSIINHYASNDYFLAYRKQFSYPGSLYFTFIWKSHWNVIVYSGTLR